MYNRSFLNDFYVRLTNARKSESTIYNYRIALEHFFGTEGDLDLSVEYIEERLGELQHLSANSLRLKLSSLSELLKFIHRKQQVEHFEELMSICSSVKAEHKETKVISDEELDILLDSCSNIKDKCIIKLLYCTGCRISELINLKVSDVVDGKIHIRISEGVRIKNNQERTIPLPKCAQEILKTYMETFAPTNALFVSTTGKPIGKNAVQQMFLRLSKATGIQVNAHQFRHKFIDRLLVAGVDLKTIQSLTGQSSSSMVLYYASTSDELKKNAVSVFDEN